MLKRNLSVLPGTTEEPQKSPKEGDDDSDSDSGRSTAPGEELRLDQLPCRYMCIDIHISYISRRCII